MAWGKWRLDFYLIARHSKHFKLKCSMTNGLFWGLKSQRWESMAQYVPSTHVTFMGVVHKNTKIHLTFRTSDRFDGFSPVCVTSLCARRTATVVELCLSGKTAIFRMSSMDFFPSRSGWAPKGCHHRTGEKPTEKKQIGTDCFSPIIVVVFVDLSPLLGSNMAVAFPRDYSDWKKKVMQNENHIEMGRTPLLPVDICPVKLM